MKKILTILGIFLFLNACSNQNDNTIKNKLNEIEYNLNSIKEKQISDKAFLQNQINGLEKKFALFTPSSKGYMPVLTDAGYLLISLKNIVKYADGYKVTFLIGNPNSFTINGIKLNISYGKSPSENYDTWANSLKKQEVKSTELLYPGVWNKMVVVLSPATAQETGCIVVSPEIDNILLKTDYRDGN